MENNNPLEGLIMAFSDKPLSLEIAPGRGFMYQLLFFNYNN